MPDHRLGMAHAIVEAEGGTARVRLTLEWERSLESVMYAIACASPGAKPGRTLERHIRWPEPILSAE